MKKFLFAVVLVASSLAYVFVSRSADASQSFTTDAASTATQSSSTAAPIQITNDASSNLPASSAPTTPVQSTTPTPAPTPVTPKTTGEYVDGTYTGSVADAYYGTIQVEAVISGGKLADVNILQYPNDRSTSVEINRQALPILISEAISAQSANVDSVSGASDTSPAFRQSLTAALGKAKA